MKKLNNTYRLLLTLVVMFVLGASIPAKAELTCPDAGLLSGKLLTDVCWSCIFPIRVAGLPLGSGSVPSGASNKSFCLCEDNLGVPRPGIVTSMWEPARLIELVRTPGCSPSLGGIRLPLGDRRLQGGHGEGEYDNLRSCFLPLPLLRLSAIGHARFIHGWQLQCRWLHGL